MAENDPVVLYCKQSTPMIKKLLPNAEIVYDRYHVQAQFGRDVMGQVRLEAARVHK